MKRICIECCHFKYNGANTENGTCEAPQNYQTISRISGITAPTLAYASNHRNVPWPVSVFLGVCGKSGRWWEAK